MSSLQSSGIGSSLLVMIGHAPYPELARAFVATKDPILDFVARHDPPFIAKVYRPSASEIAVKADAPGNVTLWYPR